MSMKNTTALLLFVFTLLSLGSYGQISDHAIGVRLDGGDGIGPEVSYQRALGGNNRLEFDLGFNDSRVGDAFKLTGLYQWVWNLQGGFNWFAGAGGGVGFFERNDDFFGDDDDRLILSGDGVVGIEYSFIGDGVPLMLALDLNPEINFTGGDGFDMDFGFSVRYQF